VELLLVVGGLGGRQRGPEGQGGSGYRGDAPEDEPARDPWLLLV
jgi:hypothetical protein